MKSNPLLSSLVDDMQARAGRADPPAGSSTAPISEGLMKDYTVKADMPYVPTESIQRQVADYILADAPDLANRNHGEDKYEHRSGSVRLKPHAAFRGISAPP